MSTKKLNGKVAVVTGASKGIGASIARHYAAEGAAVLVNYSSSKTGADEVVAEITKTGGKAIAVQANVAKKAEIGKLLAETKKAFGTLDAEASLDSQAVFNYKIVMSKQITTIARLKAKPGAEARLEELLKSLIEPTRAESGCIDYTMHRDLEEPGAYYFYDNWRSQEALDAHFEMPHMKRIIEIAPEVLAEPLKLIRLEII